MQRNSQEYEEIKPEINRLEEAKKELAAKKEPEKAEVFKSKNR